MKKLFKISLMAMFAILVFSVVTFAQMDSTTVTTTGGGVSWITNNWQILLAVFYGVYELVVRYFPTVSNVSLLSWVIKIIQAIVPNNKAGLAGQKIGTHE
jgi:hypothetical protein